MSPGPEMPMYVIYQHPRDYPEHFVVRKFIVQRRTVTATGEFSLWPNLNRARTAIPRGMINITRHPDDEPQIVESWC